MVGLALNLVCVDCEVVFVVWYWLMVIVRWLEAVVSVEG